MDLSSGRAMGLKERRSERAFSLLSLDTSMDDDLKQRWLERFKAVAEIRRQRQNDPFFLAMKEEARERRESFQRKARERRERWLNDPERVKWRAEVEERRRIMRELRREASSEARTFRTPNDR